MLTLKGKESVYKGRELIENSNMRKESQKDIGTDEVEIERSSERRRGH